VLFVCCAVHCAIEDFAEEGIKPRWASRTFIAPVYEDIQN
jgi:hydrogenase maturation factor